MAAQSETGGDENKPLTQLKSSYSIDVATLFGLLSAILLIGAAIVTGGSAGSFLDLPSVLIVVGGTLGVTTACFSIGDMLNAFKSAGGTIFRVRKSPKQASLQLLQLAQIARFRGALAMQNYLKAVESQPTLQQGLSMVIDGNTGDDVERIMQREVQSIAQRHSKSIAVMRKAADISPAMGLIGTLVGLVQMLANLDDPNTIGPSMAVALLTTFYGAFLSNVLFTPLATKMEGMASEEILLSNLYVMASASIAKQENPRRLEMLLNTILPPSDRVDFFA